MTEILRHALRAAGNFDHSYSSTGQSYSTTLGRMVLPFIYEYCIRTETAGVSGRILRSPSSAGI